MNKTQKPTYKELKKNIEERKSLMKTMYFLLIVLVVGFLIFFALTLISFNRNTSLLAENEMLKGQIEEMEYPICEESNNNWRDGFHSIGYVEKGRCLISIDGVICRVKNCEVLK